MRTVFSILVLFGLLASPLSRPLDSLAAADKVFTAVPPKPFLLDIGEVRARTGRVPRGYGKLGLSKDQKERIYGIQAAYGERIKELEAEIDQLKEEQTIQIKSVLNEAQRLQVERAELETAKKKDADAEG